MRRGLIGSAEDVVVLIVVFQNRPQRASFGHDDQYRRLAKHARAGASKGNVPPILPLLVAVLSNGTARRGRRR